MSDQIPKEIAAAIVLVMRAVGRVAKEAKNQHGGYKYASVDSFLEATNPACAEAGLIVKPVQTCCELDEIERWDKDGKARKARIARFKFKFRLIHESGAMWTDPDDERTVACDWTGPQTFQAGESFALKAYLRTLCQIPTGDADADAQEQHNAEIIRATVKAVRAKKETGNDHILIDFGSGLEPTAAADVSNRVMTHLMNYDAKEAAEWWTSQRHGREQFHNQFPKLALELKRKVEGYLSASGAAE
jgi:hypothetical protein